jgi:hypothetical protein
MIIFNNNISKRTIKSAYKKEDIIIAHFRSQKKAIQAAKRVRKYGKKYMNRVCIWFTCESRKQFQSRLRISLVDPLFTSMDENFKVDFKFDKEIK